MLIRMRKWRIRFQIFNQHMKIDLKVNLSLFEISRMKVDIEGIFQAIESPVLPPTSPIDSQLNSIPPTALETLPAGE